jgi:hypothetical protein
MGYAALSNEHFGELFENFGAENVFFYRAPK